MKINERWRDSEEASRGGESSLPAESDGIAIIGMGCRLPGKIETAEAYWDLLAAARDAISEIPPDRWDVDTFYHPEPGVAGKMYTRYGGFIDDVEHFDARFFQISPREAEAMDPEHRHLLETSWRAIEDAGIDAERLNGSKTGVFVGISNNDYQLARYLVAGLSANDTYSATGTAMSVAAGRISYIFGFRGPALSIDTACSSSLVAIHQACQSLRNGEADLALAGGVSLILSPFGLIARSQARMMSPDGRCYTFDAAANGYVRGEACGMIVLKRLQEAVEDGDRILGVIRGSAVNQDGQTPGLTAPNPDAQVGVIDAALRVAGKRADEIQYVEAHGTGTALGDPIELRALGEAYGTQREAPLLVGSVKTNVGHAEAAAGVTGLIKTVLALQRQTIPPHLHFKQGNPAVDWNTLSLEVTTSPRPWLGSGRPRAAGISSFGFSGTNAHVILEEPPAVIEAQTKEREVQLLPISAKYGGGVEVLADQFARLLESDSAVALSDVCYSAGAGRTHFDERLAIVATTPAEAVAKLRSLSSEQLTPGVHRRRVEARRSGPCFLFTGQGALYPGMGADLYESEPAFAKALDRCALLADPELERPLLDVLLGRSEQDAALAHEAAFAQPALFSLEYALARLWESWGIIPAAVMGHSLGEYAAACIAGVLSLEDAVRLVVARGLLMQNLPKNDGAMLSVMADEERVREVSATYGDSLSIAALNGPQSIVLSGDDAAVAGAAAAFERLGVTTRALRVSHAFHSAHMDPMLEAFGDVVRSISVGPPVIPLVSSLTGDFVATEEMQDPAYWTREIREPVQFLPGMKRLWNAGHRTFVEIGPHPVLLGLGRTCVSGENATWLPSMRRGAASEPILMDALAQLYALGESIDWDGVFGRRRKTPIPGYPFQRERYGPEWKSLAARGPAHLWTQESGAPLLGRRIESPLISGLLFEQQLSAGSPAYLVDHRVHGAVILPAMAYVQMAMAAAAHLPQQHGYRISRLTVKKPLLLPEDGVRQVQIAVKVQDGDAYAFEVYSRGESSEEWTQHVSAQLQADVESTGDSSDARVHPFRLLAEPDRVPDLDKGDVEEYFRTCANYGTHLGPSFRALQEVRARPGASVAHVRLPEVVDDDAAAYVAHPVLIDSLLHAMCAAIPESEADAGVHVPLAVKEIRVLQPGCTEAWVWTSFEGSGDDQWKMITGDVSAYDREGELIAELRKVEMRRVGPEMLDQLTGSGGREGLWDVDWKSQTQTASKIDLSGNWLIATDDRGAGAELAARMEAHGARCIRLLTGDVVNRVGEDAWSVDPRDREGLERVIASTQIKDWRGLVYCWGLNAERMDPASANGHDLVTGGLLHLAQIIAARFDPRPRLWVLTQGARLVANDPTPVNPAQTPLWGLARTIGLEYPGFRPSCLDLDPVGDPDVAPVLQSIGSEDAEREIAFRDGHRYVARVIPHAARRTAWPWSEKKPFNLHIARRGTLDQLVSIPASRRAPGPGEVEVRVLATGLNFRDVLNALGMYPGDPGPPGSECAGRVVRTGPGVRGVKPGDEVMALATSAFSTYVVTPEAFVAARPANLTLPEAAAIPIAMLTAYHGLYHLAGLTSADRVLIHSAAGGVGQAAVRLALGTGAEVFATAGSEEKRSVLRALGVRHVYDSRSLDFVDQIASATNGEGVSVVLNALTGEYVDAGLKLLSDGGHFLEIGKRDIRTDDQVRSLNAGVHYHPYDLAQVMQEEPVRIQEMLQTIRSMLERGELTSPSVTAFPVWEVESAFRYMARARHIGKLVVVQPDEAQERAVPVRPDGTYLITGGLRGLGLLAAEWLADRGAKHLVLIGRSELSSEAREAVDRLLARGVAVEVAQADVGRREDVAVLMRRIQSTMPELRGIMHAAGVLDDGLLADQDLNRMRRVMHPKVAGSWLLHEATRDFSLDFFVLFSSVASALGSAAQGNYSAANAFLDGLAEHRRSIGLPALSISWGPWSEVGMASRLDESMRRRMQATGLGLIAPHMGLTMLDHLLSSQQLVGFPAHVVAVPINWTRYHQLVLRDHENPLFSELAGRRDGAIDGVEKVQVNLKALLQEADPEARPTVLADYLRQQISRITGLPVMDVPSDVPLTQFGLDSLMAVEFKSQVESAVAATISVNTLLRGASLHEVAIELMEQMESTTVGTPVPPAEAITVEQAQELLAQVDAMPDEQVEALLEQIARDRNGG